MGDQPMGQISMEQWGLRPHDALREWDTGVAYSRRMQPSEISVDSLNALLVVSSNHDRMTWIGPGDRRRNYEYNVRVSTKVRGVMTSTFTRRPRALDDWVRTTWAHRNGCWTLWEREVASSTGMRVNQTPDLKMVILLQPPRDYMSQLPTPPKPPRPPRLLGKPPKRDGKSVRMEPVASPPRDQRNDDLSSIGSASDTSEMSVVPNKSRRVKSEPRDAPPQHEHITNVAILRTGYVADSSSSSSQDDPSGLVLHADDDGSVEKHVTMSRKRKKEFETNIDNVNFHMMSCFEECWDLESTQSL